MVLARWFEQILQRHISSSCPNLHVVRPLLQDARQQGEEDVSVRGAIVHLIEDEHGDVLQEEEGKFLRAAAGGFAIQQDEEMQAQREAMWQTIQGFQAPEGL